MKRSVVLYSIAVGALFSIIVVFTNVVFPRRMKQMTSMPPGISYSMPSSSCSSSSAAQRPR
jgi:hypothetical protein